MNDEKRNIIVVECISTGINYIEDIINRGYNPIVLEPKMIDTEEITKDEIAWAIAALATLPLAMLETLEPNTHTVA